MPEMQFYSTWDEAVELVGAVAAQLKLRLVPEVPVLAEPKLATYDRMGPEVAALLAAYPVVELEGTFTRHPLSFAKRESGTAIGSYYVANDVGPRFRLFMPGMNGTELTPGSLSMLAHYRNPETNAVEPSSDELKAAFKEVVAALKQHLVKHVIRKDDAVWIGERAKQRLDRGTLSLSR